MGLSLSLLTCLCAWPVALAIATLMEHFKGNKAVVRLNRFLKVIESLPLIVFAFLYIEVVGFYSYGWFEKFWGEFFTTSHFLTKGIAFALTILLYPFSLLPFFESQPNIDLFYQKILTLVAEFAEVGLVTSVIVFGLMVYIIPKMILRMNFYLNSKNNSRAPEVIQSIGGTHWESVYMTVIQSMKVHFNLIILRFTRICFFEALITYTVLNSFFSGKDTSTFHWGTTISAMFVVQAMEPKVSLDPLCIIAGLLSICYIIFVGLEKFFRKKLQAQNV